MRIRTLLLIGLFINSMFLVAQPTPNEMKLSLVESIGDGCGQLSDPVNGLVCFDVVLEIDVSGWQLRSYNIWMDYGMDSTVFSYDSDISCHHEDGGDIDGVNSFGKYRFLAANIVLDLGADTPAVIQNFCLEIKDPSRASTTPITPGGEIFGLVTSMNLVSPTSQNAINPEIGFGSPFTVEIMSAVDDLNKKAIQVSPNPFYQDFYITAQDKIERVQLFDLKGQSRLVLDQLNTNEVNLSAANLDAGFYIVHVKTETDVQVQKILKME